MKKMLLPGILLTFLLACGFIPPTPDDFPPPPSTIIVEFPTPGFVSPTPEPRTMPITTEKMTDARTFALILYTNAASGNSYGVAETVHYPIDVKLNGVRATIFSADQFVENYDKIFDKKIMDVLTSNIENDLILLPEGVRVGHGELWFNLFCKDTVCKETQFLITQINN